MKASELIMHLSTVLFETGEDPEIYFDTEASKFDVHVVQIEHVDFDDRVFGEGGMIFLKCDNEFYNHKK